MKKKSILNK